MGIDFGRALGAMGNAAQETATRAGGALGAAASSAGQGASRAAQAVKSCAGSAGDAVSNAIDSIARQGDEEFLGAETKKKDMVFKNSESLQQVVNVLNEASAALEDTGRTIRESSIPEVLSGALGAGMGGVISFGALYGLGTAGLSAAGITSGLATAGSLVGGGMVAGVGVLAAPAVILGVGGYALASNLKGRQLRQEKERLYKEALAKHQAIIEALQAESKENAERMEYLQSLNVLLERAVADLARDLGV